VKEIEEKFDLSIEELRFAMCDRVERESVVKGDRLRGKKDGALPEEAGSYENWDGDEGNGE
jgi:hypothetical protein